MIGIQFIQTQQIHNNDFHTNVYNAVCVPASARFGLDMHVDHGMGVHFSAADKHVCLKEW